MISGIILAAGESSRMGLPKASLEWQGTSLLAYQIRELGAVADDVIVVLGHDAESLEPIVDATDARVIVNRRYASGRASSIAAAADGMHDAIVAGAGGIRAAAILIVGVDQPRPRTVHHLVVDAVANRQAVIARAVHRGLHGHPTAFAGNLLSELRSVDEQGEGMKSLLRRHAASILDVECDDPIVLVNLNTPDDYRAALQRFRQ